MLYVPALHRSQPPPDIQLYTYKVYAPGAHGMQTVPPFVFLLAQSRTVDMPYSGQYPNEKVQLASHCRQDAWLAAFWK